MSTEKAVPIKPENNAKIRYKVPISFALDEKNHRSSQRLIEDLFIDKSEFSAIYISLFFLFKKFSNIFK